MTQNKPIHTIRSGPIYVSIWRNPKPDDQSGFWYEAVPGRTYTDTKDQAQTAHSFSNGDILVIAELMSLAWHWIRKAKTADRQGGAS